MRSSFRIEWYKNFREHVSDLKNTVVYENYSFFLLFAFISKFSIKMIVSISSVRNIYDLVWTNVKIRSYKKLLVLFWAFMTWMSDLSRVLIETLSDKLYSTRRETDFICGRTNWRFFAPRKTLIAHKIKVFYRYYVITRYETIFYKKYFSRCAQ